MRVRALKTCFVGNMLRQAGSEFEFDDSIEGSTVLVAVEEEEPVEVPQTPAKKKAKKKAAKKSS
jgi:hypothetical protein